MNDDNEYLLSLLEYPAESVTIDYKAAVQFNEKDDFSVKLVKHILGFANSGGGYIIIGFCEDNNRKQIPDPNLTEAITGSYEVTQFSQYVHSFLFRDDKLELTIKKICFKDGKTYPVIQISGFKKRPFFCSKQFKSQKNGENILEEGAIYIRSLEAKTIKLKEPGEWERLIDKCFALRREDLAVNFKELLDGYFSSKNTEVINDDSNWIDGERKKSKERLIKAGFNSSVEIVLNIPNSNLSLDYKNLMVFAEKSECHNTGWPIGVTMTREEFRPIPITDGIAATIVSSTGHFDYWTLKKKGNFYFMRNLKEDRATDVQPNEFIFFDTLIYTVGEGVLYCTNLCRELALGNSVINISFRYDGMIGRKLVMSPWSRGDLSYERKCGAEFISVEIRKKAQELVPFYKDIVLEVVQKVMIMFDFFEPARASVDYHLDRFLESKV